MQKILFTLTAILLASAAFSTANAAAEKTAKNTEKTKLIVTEVLDGDTLRGVIGCQEFVTIRLADIDCAEKSKKTKKIDKQAKDWSLSQDELIKLGKKSKDKLDALLKTYESEIYFVETPEKVCKTGNGDRLVGIVYAKDINVNEFMVKEGKCKPFTCSDK